MSSRPLAAAAAESGDAALARDIVTLHKALSLETSRRRRSLPLPSSDQHPKLKPSSSRKLLPTPSTSSTSSTSSSSSFWKKSITAISHLGRRRLDCAFSLHVHSIDGLPAALDGTSICIHFRRSSSASSSSSASTRPVAATRGAAGFEETLTQRSPVYYSRGGGGGNRTAKYEPRVFTVAAARTGAASLDLGKHEIDLTRLLPLCIDDLEEGDEGGFGKWSTSFRLSGPARGARLNVTFGCTLVAGEQRKVAEGLGGRYGRMERHGSMLTPLPVRSRDRARSVEDVKVLHEVFPGSRPMKALALVSDVSEVEAEKCNAGGDAKPEVVDVLKDYALPEGEGGEDQESPQSKHCTSVEMKKVDLVHLESDCDGAEFSVIEQGIEIASKDQEEVKPVTVDDAVAQEEEVRDKPDEQEEVKPVAVDDDVVEEEFIGVKLDETQEVKPVAVDSVIVQEDDVGVKPDELAEEASSSSDELQEGDLFAADTEMEDLESVFNSLSILEPEEFESLNTEDKLSKHLSYADVKASYKSASMKSKSHSMGASSDAVASEFLDMLGLEHSPFGPTSDSDPESPRERLWRQFEKETLASGNGILGLDLGDGMEEPNYEDFAEDVDLSAIVREAELELQNESQPIDAKSRVKLLEDAETEALMREFGLNEKSFQSSPPGSRSGFGSPIDLPPEEPLELPPLADGLGPFVQTKDGGFLRSMNPALFKNAKNNGSLVMQASSPIVVPAEMGSGIMEILQGLASVGIEKLSMQANKLMPLEDVTGKTMQQMAWEAAPALESAESYDLLENHSIDALVATSNAAFRKGKKARGADLSSGSGEIASEYVSLEDLAPLAMDKIEALSIEGLRVQSGMSDEEAPSNISAQSIGEFSALEGKGAENSWSLGLEGTAGLQLLDVKQNGDDVDGLMGLSITLDEWMRLDSGIVDEEDQFSDRTSKILAAHHAKSMELVAESRNADKKSKRSGRRCGLLGNNFTVALMVQLRDPLRNYEPVGTPMLALIQVERVFVPPKPRIYSTVSEKGNSEQDEEPETEQVADKALIKEEKIGEEDSIPQFKITEVHVAGFQSEPEKKKFWGNQTQQQSGSRWLLAAGMGKSNKHPFMKSKAVAKPTKEMATVQPGDTLWSISSRIHGTGTKWKELAALKPHMRNPNIILSNEKNRLR